MSFGIRTVAILVTLTLFAVGPLAPVARAQAPAPPPVAAPPAAPPAQPDMFKEAVKPDGPETQGVGVGYKVLAGVMTFFLIPGRIGTCAAGTGVAVAMFATSLGSGYRWATRALEEGCGGKWVLHGEDLLPDYGRRPVVDAP